MKTSTATFVCASAATCLLLAPPYIPAAFDLPLPASISVDLTRRGIQVSPTLYGIFFEEINCAGDGGLYAELVRNRSFEDATTPDHWSLSGSGADRGTMVIDSTRPLNAFNRRSLRLSVVPGSQAACGITNGGFWGIPVVRGSRYELSFFARSSGRPGSPVRAALTSRDGEQTYASTVVPALAREWKRYAVTLTADSTDSDARLTLTPATAETVWFDVVSLFPESTWNGRSNGLRRDLARMLAQLQPAFVRFPGGCWVEGEVLRDSYRWKETIGGIEERPTKWNLWNYQCTNGLGYHEYLQMCEDLKAEPLFVVNCGMSHRENVPIGLMQEWVQDALDAVEYANGPVTSHWGGVRARNGHLEPFNLRYVEIGNENGGKEYEERYALFHDALKKRFPNLHLIADVWGGTPGSRPADIIDEHYYSNPDFFYQQSDRYDRYDRAGPRVYVGEFAVTSGNGSGALRGALAEAAFMTGMERNSDVVTMASYAPLFANVHHRGWVPDLINFDRHRVYGTPSYYVQLLFSNNRPDATVPLELEALPPPPRVRHGAVGVGTWNTEAEFKDVRVVRGGTVLYSSAWGSAVALEDFAQLRGEWGVEEGALRQREQEPDRRAVLRDTSWQDYTVSLKARKIAGAEGFLVLFHVRDREDYSWWNIGGWGNTRHAIEVAREGGKSLLGEGVPGAVDVGRWYDIRVELTGQRVRCFLENRLIHDVQYSEPKPLYASAGILEKTGELILKVINRTESDMPTQFRVRGAEGTLVGMKTVLTAGSLDAENSLEHPFAVSPVSESFSAEGPDFPHLLPARSLTVLRLKQRR